MNELLRRFLLQAGLREDDVAARLGVDPKTVRRWLNGRVPYPHNRAAIADLLGAEEADLWPGASGTLTARIRPDELRSVYPHRLAVPREVWIRFFSSAEREIGILAYSALFLAEDRGILRLLAEKGRAGVNIRIALGDPESSHAAQRGEEDVGDAMPAKIRKALTLYRSVAEVENVEIRLHQSSVVQLDLSRRRPADRQSARLWHPSGTCTGILPARHWGRRNDRAIPRQLRARVG